MKTHYDPTRKQDGIVVDQIYSGGNQLLLGKHQDIHAAHTSQQYSLGTRLVEGDRVFRYALAGAALNRFIGGFNNIQWPLNAALTEDAALGATEVSVPDATAVVNYYAGGYVVFFTSPLQMYRILSSTVSDGTDVVLTLETGLKVACPSTTWATGYPSIYRDLRNICSTVGYNSVVGVPVIDVASGSYFWAQTWGPCFAVADGTVPGITSGARTVFWAQSGNVEPYADSGAGIGQMAGFIIPRTQNGSGDQFYMLMLSP